MIKNHVLFIALTSLFNLTLFGQDAISTSGANRTTSSGSISFTVGQLNYVHLKNSGGSISQGVQHAYKVYTTNIKDIKLVNYVSLYPNPSSDQVFIDVKGNQLQNGTFKFIDNGGKLIKEGLINQDITVLDLKEFPTATYFIKIFESQTEIETFKLVKN